MTSPDMPSATPDDARTAEGAGLVDTGPQESDITAFWELARGHAGLGRHVAVTGRGATAAVPPPAWSFGDSPELADELLALVLSGRKQATSVSVAELEAAGEPAPVVGDLSIVLDGRGHPRALLRTTAVETVRLDDVDAEHAWLEGEGDRSLESWRREHETYWTRVLPGLGATVGPDLQIVMERFERSFPHEDASVESDSA